MESAEGLNHFKVGLLPTVFYIPDFISDEDETMILDNVPNFTIAFRSLPFFFAL